MGTTLVGRIMGWVCVAFLASGCCRSSGSSGSGSSSPGQKETPAATTVTGAAGAGAGAAVVAPPKVAPPIVPAGRGADGLPAEIPETRSKVPTLAEWDAAREITVARSTPLGCETKMVREWLRVSCRGKSHTGGKPGNVTKQSGCTGETLLYAKAETTTSMVSPVLRGKSCEVRFTWTNDRAAWLSVDWAPGTPRPVIAFRE